MLLILFNLILCLFGFIVLLILTSFLGWPGAIIALIFSSIALWSFKKNNQKLQSAFFTSICFIAFIELFVCLVIFGAGLSALEGLLLITGCMMLAIVGIKKLQQLKRL